MSSSNILTDLMEKMTTLLLQSMNILER